MPGCDAVDLIQKFEDAKREYEWRKQVERGWRERVIATRDPTSLEWELGCVETAGRETDRARERYYDAVRDLTDLLREAETALHHNGVTYRLEGWVLCPTLAPLAHEYDRAPARIDGAHAATEPDDDDIEEAALHAAVNDVSSLDLTQIEEVS